MKSIYTFICFMLIAVVLNAQTPAGFNYQAVIRNNSGELVKNSTIGVRFSILKDSGSGAAVYTETINPSTNENGLVTAEIGKANPSQFSQIDWSTGTYFLKTETDISGGTNYSISGVSQLLSVPYAKYAEKSGDGLKINGTPQPGDILYNIGLSWDLLPKGKNGQTLRLDNGQPKWGEPGYALPMVTTNLVSDVLQTSAISGGNVIATGYSDITARGVCWGTNQNPTIADSKTTDPIGIGTFTSTLTGLTSNTTYYARAYATNGAGIAYGNQVTFKTFLNVVFPTVTTNAATNITANAVTSGGNITDTGGGEVTERGVCWSDHQNPTISDNKTNDGNGTGQFRSQIAGLMPGTYYARAYATNSAGTGYGNMVTFATEKTLPVLTTKAITEISAMGAVSGGNISTAGGGTIYERGICWSESPNPTILDYKGISNSTLTGFSLSIIKALPNRTYYVRAYAKNEIGIAYGEQKNFTTPDANSQSFETGMIPAGWNGNWVVNNERALDGSYSLRSRYEQDSDITFSVILVNPGQISFFYSFANCGSISLYIDDNLIQTYAFNSGEWLQALNNIDAGSHKIRWHLTADYCGYAGRYVYGTGYIDNIVLPK
jgi:hypothetical protein